MAGLFTAPDPNPAGFIDCPGNDCVMIVSGKVTSLDSVSDTTAKFSGDARVILSDAYQDAFPEGTPRILEDVPFHVHVTEGGAGVGTLQLHIFEMHIPMSPGVVNSGNIVIQP